MQVGVCIHLESRGYSTVDVMTYCSDTASAAGAKCTDTLLDHRRLLIVLPGPNLPFFIFREPSLGLGFAVTGIVHCLNMLSLCIYSNPTHVNVASCRMTSTRRASRLRSSRSSIKLLQHYFEDPTSLGGRVSSSEFETLANIQKKTYVRHFGEARRRSLLYRKPLRAAGFGEHTQSGAVRSRTSAALLFTGKM